MAQHCELRLRAGSTAAEPLLNDATFQRAPELALQHRDVRREVVVHVELRAVFVRIKHVQGDHRPAPFIVSGGRIGASSLTSISLQASYSPAAFVVEVV